VGESLDESKSQLTFVGGEKIQGEEGKALKTKKRGKREAVKNDSWTLNREKAQGSYLTR